MQIKIYIIFVVFFRTVHEPVRNYPCVLCKYVGNNTNSLASHMLRSHKKKYKVQKLNTGLFKMIVGVLTSCHTQHTWDSSICVFLFNRTMLHIFVIYLTGALYVHPLWFYRVIRNYRRGFNNLSYTTHLR